MEHLVRKLQRDYPDLIFTIGLAHCWSPHTRQIFYEDDDEAGLLHELGHATLGHHDYDSDVDLLHKEVEAWEKACELAAIYSTSISESHIQECLDTYRDWLHRRSKCPACSLTGLQHGKKQYRCLNCAQTWTVSTTRLNRPYRRTGPTKNRRA